MSDTSPGPTSRIFFSQRLRLHYVDWGNAEAPPLLLVHGGRDHCRNWDWVAEELGRDWHIIAPDLRGHGDSQWSQDGTYTMAGYVYDLAQLIHQQKLAPVTIVAHSLGGNIALRYAGTLSRERRKAGRRSRGWAHRPGGWPSGARSPSPSACAPGSTSSAALSGRLPRRYASDRGRLEAHAGGEQAPHARAGAPPHPARRQPERGRHLQLEVRQLRALLAALRHDARRGGGAVGAHQLPDAARLRQGELGVQSGRGRPRRSTSRTPRSCQSSAPATGCITTGWTSSSPWHGGFYRAEGVKLRGSDPSPLAIENIGRPGEGPDPRGAATPSSSSSWWC